jgi:hypothetical protein
VSVYQWLQESKAAELGYGQYVSIAGAGGAIAAGAALRGNWAGIARWADDAADDDFNILS